MHALKPLKVGLLHRIFCARSEYYFGVETLLFTDFRGSSLGTEIGMWAFLAEELPGVQVVDPIPKSRAEFLVRATAYPPGGQPSATCPVRAKVGEVDKSLSVIGDREWRNGAQTAPQPFTSMPLTWDRSFGGEGFDRNPAGRGAGPVTDAEGRVRHPLPNIEPEGHLLRSPRDRPDPAGLLPLDFSWPQRLKKAGTYNQKWADERFPGYADDIDWTIFNAASPDQWAGETWPTGTAFEFTNLHPEKTKVGGRLPPFVGRAFAVFGESVGPEQRWEEVPLHLTTLWFFPHAEKVVMGFGGAIKVREDDGSDVDWLVLGAEHADRPKPLSHYQGVMKEREGFEPEAIAARFSDTPLLPEGVDGGLDEAARYADAVSPKQLMRRNATRGAIEDWEEARQRCVEAGVDPDEMLGPCPFVEEEYEAPGVHDIERVMHEALEQKKDAERQLAEAEVEAEKLQGQMRAMAEEAGFDVDAEAERAMDERPAGAPIQWARDTLARMVALAATFREMGVPQPELEARHADPAYLEELRELERMQIEGYLASAHMMEDSLTRAPDEDALELTRAWIESELAAGKRFVGKDLTGVSFAGLDLSDADFTGAFLEHADFGGARCVGTDFSRAVLARTRWKGAEVASARFVEANLGRADLAGLTLSAPCDFTDAILDFAAFGGTALTRCTLTRVRVEDADLSGVDLRGATAELASFRRCSFEGACFADARFSDTDFDSCSMQGVDFSGASLDRCSFLDSNLAKSDFSRARAQNLRVLLGSVLDDCDFSEGLLVGAHFRGSSLVRALFACATLDGADLSECDLTEAVLRGARARRARFTRAVLERTDLRDADLMFALLDKATIPGAIFSRANLFTADFALVKSDGHNDLDGANTTRVKTKPLRNAE